jgi:trehalose 6-phosphate phosphatase
VLPPLAVNKGTAVRQLLAERNLRRALYAGDDTTDLDGFRALDGLDVSVRIAVVSEEGPAELREAADLLVGRPEELLSVLQRL